MDLRELTPADLPALVELCQRSLRDQVTHEVMRRSFLAEPGLRPELHLGLWDGLRLVGAALGSLRDSAAGLVGGLRLLAVAPELRRRGHGGRLLEELERRLSALGVQELRVGRLAPNYLWPGLDPRDTAALCMLERRGYTRAGEAVNMEVDLTTRQWWGADEAATLRPGWAIRRAEEHDREPLAAWVEERFSSLWAWEVRAALDLSPAAVFVAEREGLIGGFACHSVSGLPGTFGPTGTDELLRGAGLGRALLLRCLADLRERGYERVEIAWVGPVAFYSHVAGAAISRVCWFYHKRGQGTGDRGQGGQSNG
jgi:GNAT superfamily N-acetyltransferase